MSWSHQTEMGDSSSKAPSHLWTVPRKFTSLKHRSTVVRLNGTTQRGVCFCRKLFNCRKYFCIVCCSAKWSAALSGLQYWEVCSTEFSAALQRWVFYGTAALSFQQHCSAEFSTALQRWVVWNIHRTFDKSNCIQIYLSEIFSFFNNGLKMFKEYM